MLHVVREQSSPLERKIRVLIVDDSILFQKFLMKTFGADESILVVGCALDPYMARDMIVERKPDVITLDVNMPKMDGLTFLHKLMESHPLPVVMISALSQPGSRIALSCLEAGAVDIIGKKELGTPEAREEIMAEILDKVHAAALAKIQPWVKREPIRREVSRPQIYRPEVVVAIGASTGGTDAIKEILTAMPSNCPPILVVQHMPEHFTASFAARLNDQAHIRVKEAATMDRLEAGHAYIAPGDQHLIVRKTMSGESACVVRQGPRVCRHRPSVDVLFKSVSKEYGSNAVGVLLTGMGADGAQGLLTLRQGGGHSIAQDESTSLVFGMPAEAIKLGAAEAVLPLQQIPSGILEFCRVKP